jgi:hypothetical protein
MVVGRRRVVIGNHYRSLIRSYPCCRHTPLGVLKARHTRNLSAVQRVLAPIYFDRLQADEGPRRHWEAILPIVQACVHGDPAAMMQAILSNRRSRACRRSLP